MTEDLPRIKPSPIRSISTGNEGGTIKYEMHLPKAVFTTGDNYDPITGGKLVKRSPIRIVSAPQVLTVKPTPKQSEYIKQMMAMGDFACPEDVIYDLLDRAMELN